jgi:hypothetical protein
MTGQRDDALLDRDADMDRIDAGLEFQRIEDVLSQLNVAHGATPGRDRWKARTEY